MAATLSPYRLGKARDLYNFFNVFNNISWQFLTGNIITLFVLRMGASSTYIGILSALLYMAFFFLPVGRILAKYVSMIKIFSFAWGGRSIGMIPLLFAPFVYASGRQDTALFLVLLGVTLFHVIRGVGMIANNPVLSHLSQGPDQGSYMTQIQIIHSTVGMFAGFVIALLLGRDPPLILYTIIMAVGIACGIFSGVLAGKIPEPESGGENKKTKLFEVVKEAIAQKSLRNFIYILVMVALVSGVSRTFLVVYCREVFGQSDGMVSLYAVFGGLGFLIIGLLIKFLVDRIGAKPIFSVCVIIGMISMVPVIFFPVSLGDNFSTLTLYLSFLFFMLNFGWLGAEGIMQTYFIGLIPQEKMTDMGILYFFGFGIAGAGGSILAGMLLDLVTALSGSAVVSFRVLFVVLVVISALSLFLMRNLVSLGALPFRGALEVMFSFRDLKAISLLGKLSKTSHYDEEEAILGALRDAPSNLAMKGLLARIKSPRLSVRMESIQTIDFLPTLGEDAEKALMDDIINNPYTTAYRSARILGNHGVSKAVPLLRDLVLSNDYMLAGEAMVALAKLKDDTSKPEIEKIIIATQNPRLKMAGVEALGIYGSPDSLPMLLNLLTGENPPPYLRDEVILSIADILDVQTKFYPLLVRFLADESLIVHLAMDEAESAYEYYVSVHGRKGKSKNPDVNNLSKHAKAFNSAVSEFIKSSDGSHLSRWLLELPNHLTHDVARIVLAEVVLDDDCDGLNRLKLLIVHWAAHELRRWTNELK